MTTLAQQNRTMLGKFLVLVLLMAGFAFALVPLYRKVCSVIGIDATRDASFGGQMSRVDLTRSVDVQLLAAPNRSMPIRFEPVQRAVAVHPGEITQVLYRVVNTSDRTLVGQAVPSYAPERAGKYFFKLQCFCFSRQTFSPGESRDMPVVFYVSRDLPDDIGTVSLGYTFFDVDGDAPRRQL